MPSLATFLLHLLLPWDVLFCFTFATALGCALFVATLLPQPREAATMLLQICYKVLQRWFFGRASLPTQNFSLQFATTCYTVATQLPQRCYTVATKLLHFCYGDGRVYNDFFASVLGDFERKKCAARFLKCAQRDDPVEESVELQCIALVVVACSHCFPSAAVLAPSQPFSSSPCTFAGMAKSPAAEIDVESSAPVPEAGRLQRGEPGGCALCLYRWATPNPVRNRAQQQPLLGRKSRRSWYCSPRTSNVHCNWSSETCVSLQEKLANGMVSQSDYDETLKAIGVASCQAGLVASDIESIWCGLLSRRVGWVRN